MPNKSLRSLHRVAHYIDLQQPSLSLKFEFNSFPRSMSRGVFVCMCVCVLVMRCESIIKVSMGPTNTPQNVNHLRVNERLTPAFVCEQHITKKKTMKSSTEMTESRICESDKTICVYCLQKLCTEFTWRRHRTLGAHHRRRDTAIRRHVCCWHTLL